MYHDWSYLETKPIIALHLRWYGDRYKDMPISVDLVPCVEFDDYKPPRRYAKQHCRSFVFGKRRVLREADTTQFPVACTLEEQALMKGYTANARNGCKLAKAIRLTRLLTHDCVSKLTRDVTNIHDTLRTYMLKTCLFILHQRLPDPTVEMPPDQ